GRHNRKFPAADVLRRRDQHQSLLAGRSGVFLFVPGGDSLVHVAERHVERLRAGRVQYVQSGHRQELPGRVVRSGYRSVDVRWQYHGDEQWLRNVVRSRGHRFADGRSSTAVPVGLVGGRAVTRLSVYVHVDTRPQYAESTYELRHGGGSAKSRWE